MQDDYGKLRQFNHVHSDGRQLFTACIELMLIYESRVALSDSSEGLRHAYDVMVEPIRDRVNYYSIEESVRRKKIKQSAFELAPYSLEHSHSDGTLDGITQITLLRGENEDDQSDLFFDWYDSDDGYIRLGLPIEEVMANPEDYLALCLDAAAELPFQLGMAGFSMNYEDIYINGNEHLADPIIGRFPGVNVVHAGFYRGISDGLPTVNWLTLVRSELVERLGGLAKLKSQEGDGVVVHPLRHGVAVQAGPRPLLGDVNAQESLAPYYRVGEMLAPVRTRSELESGIRGSRAEATEWGHRFFGSAP
ncbi:MAG: DUF3396 domain-containing protein [Candidatus Thiodiazotropha sp. (ex Epidulcina cf. delphinae)]|nr:DUF3396 domain-containing protein [Candidatus Thiodiazotropha sp. (ex Epidulcina cf. delphinae)]